jgi:hypothetical protein
VVEAAATRGLQRSASASMEEWKGKGPSSPLGGAIVDDHGLLLVIVGYCGLGDGIERSVTLGQNGMEVRVMLGWIYNGMCLWMCLGTRQFYTDS